MRTIYRVITDETIFGIIVREFNDLEAALEFVRICLLNDVPARIELISNTAA